MKKERITVSLYQFSEMFPDADAARVYIEKRRWANGVVCPFCKEVKRITVRKGGYYRCNVCKEDFTVRTGTIFERSHVPLHKWLCAMYMLMTARKGVSSLQLSKEIGITQKSAWFLLHRIREACGNDLTALRGIVQIDETYIGGKESNKYEKQKLHMGRGGVGKTPVIGMREKGGRTLAMPIVSVDTVNLEKAIHENVEAGSMIHTDENAGYRGLSPLYGHETINHTAKEYVRGDVSTNDIESVWALLKRGVHGVYHHVSKKHLGRYVNEFSFRLNDGNVQRDTMDRLASLVTAAIGRRIKYSWLIA